MTQRLQLGEVFKDRAQNHVPGRRRLPLQGVFFTPKAPYLFLDRDSLVYKSQRTDFNNYGRSIFTRFCAKHPEIREYLRNQIKEQRRKALLDKSEPIDDNLLFSILTSQGGRERLLDAGLEYHEEGDVKWGDLVEFEKESCWADANWVIDGLLSKEEIKDTLEILRKSPERLAQYGVHVDDLKGDKYDIWKGDGSFLLRALALAPESSKFLQQQIYQKHYDAFMKGTARLGRILKPEVTEIRKFLQKEGYPRQNGKHEFNTAGFWDMLHQRTEAEFSRLLNSVIEIGQEKEPKQGFWGKFKSAARQTASGIRGFLQAEGFLKKTPEIEDVEDIEKITRDFLKKLKATHPAVYQAFVEKKARELSEKEFQSMQQASASVGGKRFEWWLRIFEDQKPERRGKITNLLAQAMADRDIYLMENGMVPAGYNMHHIDPLSDGWQRFNALLLMKTYLRAIHTKAERGDSMPRLLEKPSPETLRRLSKLGVISSARNWSLYERGKAPLDPAWQPYLEQKVALDAEWFNQAANKARETLEKAGLFDNSPRKNPKTGRWEFSTKVRTKLTKAGFLQVFYYTIPEICLDKKGQLDLERYKACCEALCQNIVPLILAEEKANQVLAERGIFKDDQGAEGERTFGGNQTGFFFDKNGDLQFDPKRCNLVIANSSKRAKHHAHSALHAFMDSQYWKLKDIRLEIPKDAQKLYRRIDGRIASLNTDQNKTDAWIEQMLDVEIQECRNSVLSLIHRAEPKDIFLSGPVNKVFRGIAQVFSGVYRSGSESENLRETCFAPFLEIIAPFLPEKASLGHFPDRQISPQMHIDRKSENYHKGFQAGVHQVNIEHGKVKVGIPRPRLPQKTSLELEAGIIEGRNQRLNELRKIQPRSR